MIEQNKDNLENFFQKGAQNHNLEFQESDWLQLKGQLDKEMPVRFSLFYFLRKFGIGILGLILLPVAWLTFESFSAKENMEPLESAFNSISSEPVIENEKSTINSEEGNKENSRRWKTSNVSIDKDNHKDHSGELVELVVAENEENDKLEVEEQTGIEFNNIGQVVLEEGAEPDRHIGSGQLLFLSSIPPDYTIGPGDHEVKGIEETLEVIPKTRTNTYFKLGVGYSPDFSTVGIGNFVSPGSRWTATVDFGFFKRFVITTGVVLVSNKYEAYGEDYHAPARYWKKGIVAEEAYGYCKMIDIPLNLRFNFIQKDRNMVFASAGASTYFVTKEDYYFEYEQEDPELPTHWGTDKTTVYPFGIINLSLGYEHVFTRRSGLQIEPFIKIPTTGIGWGNVDLHTMGIYFLYKYKL